MTARVLLMRLSCRTSSRGNEYLAGYLGAARVVAFKSKEPDRYGNEQWEVFVADPEPKGNGDQRPQRRDQPRQEILPPDRDATSAPRRDPRQAAVDEWAGRFDARGPDQEPSF
jgi:hypothetical protein